MFLNMYTKFIMFLFAGTIFPTQSYNQGVIFERNGEQYDRNRELNRGAESLDRSEQNYPYFGLSSGQTQPNARPSNEENIFQNSGGIQSRPQTEVGSKPSGTVSNLWRVTGIQNQLSPQGTPTMKRAGFGENDRVLQTNYNPTHASNGGGQLADTIKLPSSVQLPNAGSNNQQNKNPLILDESPVTSDRGSSLHTSSQNDKTSADPSSITYVEHQSESKNYLELTAMKSGIKIMQLIGGEKPGNNVFSPLSILIALTTLQQGASGNSERDLTNFLQSDATTSRQWIYDLTNNFKGRSGGNILKIANAIFADQTFTLSNSFKNVANRDFDAKVDSVYFRNAAETASKINGWVSAKTGSLIPSLVDARSLDTSTQLLLTNAVYFKGIWNVTFPKDRTVPRVFALKPNVNKEGVNYMHQIGQFRAGEDSDLDVKWVFLPFLNSEFNMLFLLPNEDFGLDKLIASLTSDALNKMLQDNTFREVVLGIPKFKLAFETDLVSILQQLGIQSIFNLGADLSGLGKAANQESLYVSKVLHKATIEINEEGGVAAAISGLAVNTLSLASYNEEFRFIANHPFLVLLFDKDSSVPLFIAKIVDPSNG